MSSATITNPQGISVDSNTGFSAPIVDAYGFRCLMDFIGATVVLLPIKIEKKEISAKQMDVGRTIFHHMSINTRKLPDFFINDDLDSLTLNVNMRSFRSKIKNAQKRTVTLTLFNKIDDLNRFFAVIVSPIKKITELFLSILYKQPKISLKNLILMIMSILILEKN